MSSCSESIEDYLYAQEKIKNITAKNDKAICIYNI